VSDLTLPTLMSDREASSLAPSIIPSADLVNCGEGFAEDPNCDNVSIQRAVLDFRIFLGTYKAVLVYQFLVGLR
jgi:hypothetical protein